MWSPFGTHKLCELFVADASMCSLETFRIHLGLPLCVDVTETDGCQHLYWGWLLLDFKKSLYIELWSDFDHHAKQTTLTKWMETYGML